jgi:hypothetical protein
MIDGATGQDGLISFLEIGGEMCGRKVAVRFADHLRCAGQSIVHEERPVHPQISSSSILHPRLDIRHDLKELPERETVQGLHRLSHVVSL